MIDNRMHAFALSTAFAIICSAPPAIAGKFDGSWSMVAETTHGHCGDIEIGLGINRGRIHSTSGSFAAYPIQLGGRVSASGQAPDECGGWPAQSPREWTVRPVSGPRDLDRYRALRVSARAFGTPIALSARFLDALSSNVS